MQSNIKPFNRTHGGKNALNLLNKDEIKDFSININPYGPPPEIRLSIDFALVKEYPDPKSKKLRKLIASLNNVTEENIFIGNGSAEIITLLFFCFAKKKDCLPFPNGSFDKIFCHSIFQYFPNHQYAAKVVVEMLRVMKPGGKCLIMDIPDIAKKKEYIKAKINDSHNLKRTFYNKEWFMRLVSDAEIFEQRIQDYGNSHFRFNVLIQK